MCPHIKPIPHSWKGIRPWTRHGLVLMVAGCVYILVGFSYVITEATGSREVALQFALEWLPKAGWGYIFISAGIMSIISSRWPPISETWGYSVLTGLSAAWASFYAVGVIFGDSPPTNLSSTLTWGIIAFLWWAISGLLNPEKRE